MNEPLMPQNVEAEEKAIACVLIDPAAWNGANVSALAPAHYYREAHRTIWDAALDLHRSGRAVDIITLCDELTVHGKLEQVGGASYVSSLTTLVPTSRNAEEYARIVLDCAAAREIINTAGDLAADGYNRTGAAQALRRAQERLERFSARVAASTDDLPLLSAQEAAALPQARGILGDLLFEESVGYLYGHYGRWKSFIAVSWACCIGTGTPWLGRPTVAGDVVYIAAEGARGIGKRIEAWVRYHGAPWPRVSIVNGAVDFTDPIQVDRLIGSIKRCERVGEPLAIVFLDTLSASVTGDVNSPEVGNAVTRAARRIALTFGCCVLPIHHPGKDDTRGMLGASTMASGADYVIEVAGGSPQETLEPGATVTLRCRKDYKDGERFNDIYLTTQVVRWATGKDDAEIASSLVVVPANAPAPKLPTMPNKRRIVYEYICAHGPLNSDTMETELVQPKTVSRSTLFEALSALKASDLITEDNGDYSAVLASPVSPVQSDMARTGLLSSQSG